MIRKQGDRLLFKKVSTHAPRFIKASCFHFSARLHLAKKCATREILIMFRGRRPVFQIAALKSETSVHLLDQLMGIDLARVISIGGTCVADDSFLLHCMCVCCE